MKGKKWISLAMAAAMGLSAVPLALAEEKKVRAMIAQMFRHFERAPDEMPNEYREIAYNEGIVTAVCDYIAGMTDRYAVKMYSELFIPSAWERI